MHHVDRAADIFVVLDEAGQERLDRFHLAVLVVLDDDDVTALLLRLVPGAMARDEDGVPVGLREHAAGIEAHAKRCGMRSHQADRRGVVAAVLAPAEILVEHVALEAERRAKVLAGAGHPVELVLRHGLRQPVAPVVGEIELPGFGVPVEADRVAHADGIDLRAAAIEIDPPDLAMGIVMQHVVAGLPDRDIELVVGPDSDELPAMGFVRQIVVDHRRLRRTIDDVVDLLDLETESPRCRACRP